MGKIEIIGQQPVAERDAFHCPECKTKWPPFGFNMNGGDLGMMGIVQYITIFCNAKLPPNAGETEPRKCGAILTVNITTWTPPMDPAARAALMEALRKGQIKQ